MYTIGPQSNDQVNYALIFVKKMLEKAFVRVIKIIKGKDIHNDLV